MRTFKSPTVISSPDKIPKPKQNSPTKLMKLMMMKTEAARRAPGVFMKKK